MAANPLPPIEVLKADYYRLGSIRAVSRHHSVTDHRVRVELRGAGVNILKQRGRPFQNDKHRCMSCAKCRPDRCEYINAPIEDALAALKHMGVKFQKAQHGYLVKKCPMWEKGELGKLTVNADLRSFASNGR